MIEKGNERLTMNIRDLWKNCFSEEPIRYIDYFFKERFKPEYGLALIEDNRVVSTITKIPHDVMINGRVLRVSMILGVATAPRYRNRGYMHQLMNIVLDEVEHQELITFIQSYEPGLYEQFGFRPIYYRQKYTFTKVHAKRVTAVGIGTAPTAIDLLKVYSAFISRFNGFYIRGIEHFENYIREINAQGGRVVAYYNAKGVIQGYAAMIPDGREMMIEECIYLNSVALYKLINYALQQRQIVHLSVSDAEDLSKAFPGIKAERYEFTLARLNDVKLFNRLYNSNVETIEDVFALSKKPPYMNEYV